MKSHAFSVRSQGAGSHIKCGTQSHLIVHDVSETSCIIASEHVSNLTNPCADT